MNKLTKFSRAILAIAIMLCVALPTLAHDFEVDGIYYNYLDKTAKTVEVTYKGSSNYDYSNEYTGSVTIPSSVTYSGATYSVTSIGDYAFLDCSSLTSVTIPNSVTSIGSSAFSGCSGLTSITIPNSVTSIGDFAFYDCDGLTSIVVEEGNPKYDSRDNCNAIVETSTNTLILGCKNSTIPNSVTSIGNSAFYHCKLLTSITIPNSVTSIDNYAFLSCSGLTLVPIPNSVTKIGSSAFGYCSSLNEVTIPNSVTSIGSSAFEDCTGLTSITIPNSVTSIGSWAFDGCSALTSVTIGNSVETIEKEAFRDCYNLLDVKSLNPMPQNINANAFSSTTYTNAILTVPYKCNGLYAGRTGWGSFNTIIEMEMPSIYLTIKLPESGVITHKEVYDEVAKLAFKANDGWQINTVSFNDEDVTSQLDDEGNYTTPVLTDDATLTVVFEKIPTGVEPLALTNDIKVYAKDGFIEVVGANANSVVNIYDTMGISKYVGIDNRIYLEDNGIYILTVEGRTFKFAM